MSSVLSRAARDGIETLFRVGVTGSMTDAQLLELFLDRPGDEAEDAFAAVVARHGPMVWRVCRRILADPHDAEDAFQVTFLVLARKARSLARRELLANWLYGVAVRTANQTKNRSARRRLREAQGIRARKAEVEPMHEFHATDDQSDSMLAWLDQELARLPEIFRAVIVLCELEGKTQIEAAGLIGVPPGTIASRLARGRERLRQRLTARGCALASGTLAAALAPDASAVPAELCARTVATAAQAVVAGTTANVVAAPLAELADGVTRSLVFRKLTVATTMALAALAVSAGVIGVSTARALSRQEKPTTEPGQRAAASADTSELAWIDNLSNADGPTKLRLKRCLGAALSSYAAIKRAVYEFDFRHEIAGLDRLGEVRSIEVRNYRGEVHWRDQSLRYTFVGPPPMPEIDPQGRELLWSKKDRQSSVLRSKDTLTIAFERTPGQWRAVTADLPASASLWRDRYPGFVRQLDPLVFYAKWFRTDEANFRAHCESSRSIQSSEGDGTIVLRFRRAGDDARIEILCDKKADCLPTHYRIGIDLKGKWITWAEETCEWRQTDGVWFPVHQTSEGYTGPKFTPVKFFDLTVRNFHANEGAAVPDPGFDPVNPPVRSNNAAPPGQSALVPSR